MSASTPLHELAVIGYLLDHKKEMTERLQLLYHLSLLEGKCKFQIYHMYLFLNKLLEKKDRSDNKDVASRHYKNILLYERMLHNLIFIKSHYETIVKEATDYDIKDYIVKPEDLNIKLEKPENKHIDWLLKKIKELNLFDLGSPSDHQPNSRPDLSNTENKHSKTGSNTPSKTGSNTPSKNGSNTPSKNGSKPDRVGVKSVEFYYADWCGYCTQFKPTWKNFKSYVKSNKIDVKIKEINADDPEKVSLRKKRNVQGFPTIVFVYSDNKTEFFEDERTIDNLIQKLSA